jgi:hypothetical protein
VVGRAAALGSLAALLVAPAAQAQDALPGGRALVATTSVSPEAHLFAEPVVARLDLVLDPRQFDPDRIRARLRFAPYETLGEVEESRREVGKLVHLRYTATLRCLHVACIAPRQGTILGEQEAGRAERHTLQFDPAVIGYENERGRAQTLLQRRFPPVQVVSRINTARLDEAANQPLIRSRSSYVASLEPPATTYRASPTLLAALALVAAGLLLLFPAVLLVRFVHARWRDARRPRPLSPLERALVLVEWTARGQNGAEDRRKALEALAAALEQAGARPLAETTRELAWAEQAPGREHVGEVAAQARNTVAGGGNGRPA